MRVGLAQCVGGHHGDVVADPDDGVVLVKEAGVLPGCVVVRTLVHYVRTAREAEERHAITGVRWHCACTATLK